MKANYKRMLKGMQEKENNLEISESWYLYILECIDGTYYTGVTKDLMRRCEEHNSGKGARYTRTRMPVRLVYQEPCLNRSTALIRECAVKALSRKEKEVLVTLHSAKLNGDSK